MIKDVAGYEGRYFVSDTGDVFGVKCTKLKPHNNGYGYMLVDLYKDGKMKHARVHRLVAEAFIQNPNGLPEVNHKDENKENNSASNLEWCTPSYNKKYGTGRKARSEAMKRVWKERRVSE